MIKKARKMADTYKAILKNARIAPRKARLVVDLVRRKRVSDAIDELRLMNKKAAPIVSKLLKSALANATRKATIDVDRLVVDEIYVGDAQSLKRFLPRAQGRATPLKKRSSHITIKLKEI